MQIKLKREDFAQAFALAARIAPTRSPKPILSNVLLVTSERAATLVATNLEYSIRASCEAVESKDPEKVVLNAEKVGNFLRLATADEVVITDGAKDGQIKLTAGPQEITLLTPRAEDFPEVEKLPPVDLTTANASQFSFAITATNGCTDAAASRYALGAVMLDPEAGVLVGTDGRRISVVEMGFGGKVTGLQTLIPTAAARMLPALIGDQKPEVELQFKQTTNRISFYLPGGIYFDTRLIEGRFPNYKDVVPDGGKITGSFLAGPVAAAIASASIMCDKDTKGVKFKFDGSMLNMHATNNEVGVSTASAGCAVSDPFETSLDGSFFEAFLKTLDPAETVELHLSDAESPFTLRARSGSYTHVIMPLATTDEK